MTLLDVVKLVDNFTYDGVPNSVYRLISHDGEQALGFLVEPVVQRLSKFKEVFQVDETAKTINIQPGKDTIEKRNSAFKAVADELKETGYIKGWRDELFTIYYPTHIPYLQVERAFSPLLGIVMYGIHVNGYIPPEVSSTGEIQFWIPTRSKTKSTYPGMLDNTIGGGIGDNYGVLETVIKESYEEAGLESSFVETKSKAVSTVSYVFCDTDTEYDKDIGLIQPEVQYIYDLEFDNATVPVPVDNEAESFQLMSYKDVLQNINAGNFKPNCALIIIEFLIRHGYITSENEPDYIEIVSRLHRKPPFPLR